MMRKGASIDPSGLHEADLKRKLLREARAELKRAGQ
jgi:hypothetical protein